MRSMLGKPMGFARARGGHYIGQLPAGLPLPPSFPVSGEALLAPLREHIQGLYIQLPPDLQAPFTPRLIRCNELTAAGRFPEAQECYVKLGADLKAAVDKWHKIPLAPTEEPSMAPLYLLGGTALAGLLILLA